MLKLKENAWWGGYAQSKN